MGAAEREVVHALRSRHRLSNTSSPSPNVGEGVPPSGGGGEGLTRLSERIYRTEAIILRRSELGEADRILTLYTPQWGKRRAIAKGIRRPASKLRGHLELFTRAKLLLARGRTLDVITGAETSEAFHGLRDEDPGALERIGIAYYLVELLDQFTEEEQENHALWD